MKPRGQFTVTEYVNASGTSSWRVTGTQLDGARIRENYQTREEATGRKQELEIATLNVTPTSRFQTTRLTAGQVAEAERAFGELNGKSLMDAVRFYLENYRDPLSKIPIRVALEECLAEKEKARKRPDTIRNLRGRVGMFARQFPEDRLVSEILPAHVSNFILRPGVSPTNQNNDRRALSSFFTWATNKGYCIDHPVKKVETIEEDEITPVILPLAKARKLVAEASGFKDGRLVPYVVLGLFCGLRPKELARITWDAIDLKAKRILLGATVAKLRQKRTVHIPSNAVLWLKPFADTKTPIRQANWRKDFDQVKELAGYGTPTKEKPGLTPWVQDVMRHTAISYHLAKHSNEGLTAEWAGNSPNVIHRHYKELVTRKADVAAFWNIKPSSDASGKVVSMAAA